MKKQINVGYKQKLMDEITFGKYRGEKFSCILWLEPSYLGWLYKNNITPLSDEVIDTFNKTVFSIHSKLWFDKYKDDKFIDIAKKDPLYILNLIHQKKIVLCERVENNYQYDCIVYPIQKGMKAKAALNIDILCAKALESVPEWE